MQKFKCNVFVFLHDSKFDIVYRIVVFMFSVSWNFLLNNCLECLKLRKSTRAQTHGHKNGLNAVDATSTYLISFYLISFHVRIDSKNLMNFICQTGTVVLLFNFLEIQSSCFRFLVHVHHFFRCSMYYFINWNCFAVVFIFRLKYVLFFVVIRLLLI